MPSEPEPPTRGPRRLLEPLTRPLARWLLTGPRRAERLGVALILLTALVPRLRDVAAPFDREAEGAQGAFFAISAVNYERLGLRRTAGYPVLNVDALRESASGVLLPLPTQHWLMYANHPPLVPVVAWAAVEALGPEGWDEAWREGRAPEGIELPMRLPFVTAHALFLLALWWAVREGHGAQTAMIALGLAAATPVLVFYGTLVNYENPALLFVALAAGQHVRWQREGRWQDLALFALACFAGSCVTFAGAFFLPFFVLAAFAAGRFARGALEAVVGALATALPLLLHATLAQRVGRRLGLELPDPLERAHAIVAPLLDGTVGVGVWAARQVERAGTWIGWLPVALAVVGVAVLFARLSRPVAPALQPRWRRIDVGAPLLLGGLLYLFAFYRHSYDPQHSFLMLVAPGVAVLAAVALDALGPLLLHLRAGVAPLVVVASTVCLLGVQESNLLRHRYRATEAERERHHLPPPALPLPDRTGAELAALIPPGALGLYPSATGLNLAVNFYAWRSLVALEAADDLRFEAIAEAAGLHDAPRYLLLPTTPPPEAAAQAETLRAALVGAGTKRGRGEAWEAFSLP